MKIGALAVTAALLATSSPALADPATEGQAVFIMPASRIWDTEAGWCSTQFGADYILPGVTTTYKTGGKSQPIGWWGYKKNIVAFKYDGTHAGAVLSCLPAKKYPQLNAKENLTVWSISTDSEAAVTQWVKSQAWLYDHNGTGPPSELIYQKYGHKTPASNGLPTPARFMIFGRTATRHDLVLELLGYAKALNLTPSFPFMNFQPLTMQARNANVTIAFQLTQKDNCTDVGEPDKWGCTNPDIEKPQAWVEMAVIASTSDKTAAYYAKALALAMVPPPPPPIN